MTNEDLKGKLDQALDKFGYAQDISDLEQDPKFQAFKNILKNINDLQQLHEVTNVLLDPLNTRSWLARHYHPKILETVLNYGMDINSYSEKLYLIDGLHSNKGKFFGYNTTFSEGNVGYDVAHTLTVSIARIILQNPSLLEKQKHNDYYGTANLLHSIVHTISDTLNSMNGYFMWDESHTKRESCKEYLSLLFTLMVLVSPKLLDQKYSNIVSIHAKHLELKKTPIMVFSAYLLSYGVDHPHMQELYDNFQQIIELTQDNNHVLSQKIKELINYVSSINPSSKIDSNKLKSIVSEVEGQIKTSGKNPSEKCIVDVGNLLIKNLPTIFLDRHISNLRSTDYQDALKRELLTMYQSNGKDVTGNVSNEEINKINFILEKEVFKTIQLLNKKSSDINGVVNHIKDSSAQRLIEKHEEELLKIKEFKEFLDDNPAPHEPISQERLDRGGRLKNIRSLKDQRKVKIQENKKASEKALMDIGSFFERHEEEYLSKLESEKAQKVDLARIIESEKALKAALARIKARISIMERIEIIIGIALVSVIIGLAFESFIAAIAVAAILTTAAYCIHRSCNPKVDSQLTSPQTEENTLELAAQH